jgi:hypothetical protein
VSREWVAKKRNSKLSAGIPDSRLTTHDSRLPIDAIIITILLTIVGKSLPLALLLIKH